MRASDNFWLQLLLALGLLTFLGYFSSVTGPVSSEPSFTLWQIRVPRVVSACLLGACLGLAGTLLQLATSNPLSEPELLGVNQSAVFAVILMIVLFPKAGAGLILLAAVLGGSVSGVAILLMTASGAFPRERLILAGLTIAFFFGSASSTLLLLKETDLFELLHWTAGKLSGADWTDVAFLSVVLSVGVLLSLLRATTWNALQLGDDGARNIGIDPVSRRIEVVSLAVALCAVCVAVAGPVGFVGIIVPHLSVSLAGLDYRRRLPLVFVLGACLVAAADLLGRTLLYPSEIPVGILTALVGAPYFLYRAQRL